MILRKLRSYLSRNLLLNYNEIIYNQNHSQSDLNQPTCSEGRFSSFQDSESRFLFFHDGFRDLDDRIRMTNDMKILHDFVSEAEEMSLIKELEPQLKRMRYEKNHWDNAIKGYRETEKSSWSPTNREILDRMKRVAFPSGTELLEHVHVLDLEENGIIGPHVDSVKFCGTTIAGISLLTDSVMRLVNEKYKNKIFDVLLKRRSLYIMTGSARYDYTHEILGNNESIFREQIIKKSRRISLICRNKPLEVVQT